eukprot:5599677-Pleurochrysis_carterae.AAC.1
MNEMRKEIDEKLAYDTALRAKPNKTKAEKKYLKQLDELLGSFTWTTGKFEGPSSSEPVERDIHGNPPDLQTDEN